MSWLGILLIGFAVTDLTHSVRRTRYLPECVGALVKDLRHNRESATINSRGETRTVMNLEARI